VVLLASGFKLLGASTGLLLILLPTALIGGTVAWAWVRVRHGEPALVLQDRRRRDTGRPAERTRGHVDTARGRMTLRTRDRSV
jgi:hypothetical protein